MSARPWLLAWAMLCAPLLSSCTSHGTPARAVAASFDAGPVRGCQHGTGRPGQDKVLVPGRPTLATVCSARRFYPGQSGQRHTVDSIRGRDLDRLVHVLNADRPGRTTITSCDGGGLARTYTIDFDYSDGPGVVIDIGPDCHPSISNGSIAVDNTNHVTHVIDRLIGILN